MNDENKLYLDFFNDTSNLMAEEKVNGIVNASNAFKQAGALTNDVEFWRWVGENYQCLSSPESVQIMAENNAGWLKKTVLQGKGYEWDSMVAKRLSPSKLFSRFDAGTTPTQPGIDITETNIFTGEVINTYQNKAYTSSASLNLHSTPKDAMVITNAENINNAQTQGYNTESFQTTSEIEAARNSRFEQALEGKAVGTYTFQNVLQTSVKAGAIGAVVGVGTEAIASYKSWKSGNISDNEYIEKISLSGGNGGVTGAVSTAVMVPITAKITEAGLSMLFSIPVAFVVSIGVDKIVAPCFKRGKYAKQLGEARYYSNLAHCYQDFVNSIERTTQHYQQFMMQALKQSQDYQQMKDKDSQLTSSLKKLYDTI